MSEEFLFVYGSLRKAVVRGAMKNILIKHCEYISDGMLQGKLYDIAGYPGAIQSENTNDKVYGEVYRIVRKHPLLIRLDEFEGCTEKFPRPHEYTRKKLLISLLTGNDLSAWVYIFNQSIVHRRHIESGDYLRFLEKDPTNSIFDTDSYRKDWF
jgi:gamma-glutamylcyclotransferase (GGCT)/AIG2-like uncharacterized protein YtfP